MVTFGLVQPAQMEEERPPSSVVPISTPQDHFLAMFGLRRLSDEGKKEKEKEQKEQKEVAKMRKRMEESMRWRYPRRA